MAVAYCPSGAWTCQVRVSKVNLRSSPELVRLCRSGEGQGGYPLGQELPSSWGETVELGQPTWGFVVQIDGALGNPVAGVVDPLGSRDLCQQFVYTVTCCSQNTTGEERGPGTRDSRPGGNKTE